MLIYIQCDCIVLKSYFLLVEPWKQNTDQCILLSYSFNCDWVVFKRQILLQWINIKAINIFFNSYWEALEKHLKANRTWGTRLLRQDIKISPKFFTDFKPKVLAYGFMLAYSWSALHFRGDKKEVNSSKKEMTAIGHIIQYGTRISPQDCWILWLIHFP